MYISQQLKKKNIAEYLLYMWQVEDLIRANGCDMERIRKNIIEPYPATDEQKKELARWYEDLINMMQQEGVLEKGHVQINKNIIVWLTDLHLRLLRSPKFPYYSAAYYKVLPFIVELRAKGGDKDVPELETCFDAMCVDGRYLYLGQHCRHQGKYIRSGDRYAMAFRHCAFCHVHPAVQSGGNYPCLASFGYGAGHFALYADCSLSGSQRVFFHPKLSDGGGSHQF